MIYVYPIDNLQTSINGETWSKDVRYMLIQKDGYFILTCNEGSIYYSNDVKEQVLSMFYTYETGDN